MQITQVRAPMLPLLSGLIAGLIAAKHVNVPLHLLLSLAFAGSLISFLLVWFASPQRFWAPGFLASATVCFWAYGQIWLPPTPSQRNLELPARETRISFEVQAVMGTVDRYGRASGLARVLQAPENTRLHPGDRLYVRLPQTIKSDPTGQTITKMQRGLQIEATGVLVPIKKPASNDQGGFNNYLKGIGVHYRFSRADTMRVIRPPTAFRQFCTDMNSRFQKVLKLGTPATQSELVNIYVTMLLGRKAELTDAQNERYRMTGTMHFFAISGLHIGVIAAVIAQGLLLVRIPRYLGPLIGLPLLYLYVEITGGSPSAVRAFLMTAFFWSSFIFQRQPASFSALVCSAIFVLLINPNQLWSLGFQLSYTVVGSILLFGLPLYQILRKRFKPYRWLPDDSWTARHRIVAWMFDKFFQLFAISFSAWLASAPLCASFFDFVAPGTILLNMLLVYLVAIVIISGILSLTCSFIWLLPFSEFINHSAWLITYIMEKIVIFGTQIPNLTLSAKGFPLSLSYSILASYVMTLLWLHHKPGKIAMSCLGLPVVTILVGLGLGFCFFTNAGT